MEPGLKFDLLGTLYNFLLTKTSGCKSIPTSNFGTEVEQKEEAQALIEEEKLKVS